MGLLGDLRRWSGVKANQLGVVYPAPQGNGWVDLPVWSPTSNHWTTAWSGQVPVLDPGEELETYAARLRGADPATIYRSQHQVRKVVSFIARNVASTSLKLYNRRGEDARLPVSEGPLAALLRQPSQRVTPYRLWSSILCDWLIFDRYAIWKVPADNEAGIELVRVPPRLWRPISDRMGQVTAIAMWVARPGEEPWRNYPAEDFIYDFGYSPDGAGGLTPLESLADLLAESSEAVTWRRQVWKNGARQSGWIERPIEANDLEGWDDTAEARFLADFNAKFRGNGPDAGGVPLFKDGMKFHETRGFDATDMSQTETRQLTGVEVASAFHLPPELVGAREGTYAGVREFRASLYRDALGPYFTAVKQTLNLMLVPAFAGRRRLYVDYDLDSKIRGNFEERAALTSTAVGAPWLTRNEARAIENRAPVDGGDELITPLNVLVGAQPSPQTPTGDGGDDNTEPAESPPEPRARRQKSILPEVTRDRLVSEYQRDLGTFAGRQAATVLSALGAKSVPPLTAAWDKDRWNRELKTVIVRHLLRVGELRASLVASTLETAPDLEKLQRVLDGRAAGIADGWNEHTYRLLAEALEAAEWKDAARAVFDAAAGARAGGLAMTTTTEANGLSALLAAEEAGEVFKRWVVRSRNPRTTHRALSGEVVPVDSAFSNGAMYPGAGNLPTEERARCTCDVELQREG